MGIEAPALSGDLTFYTKAGCHLCEQAEDLLAPILREVGRSVHRVDIGADAKAAERFGQRVPVLTCGPRELCWGRFDRAALRAMLGLPDLRRGRSIWPWTGRTP